MSLTIPYSTLDVFTSEPLSGNQLGVVLLSSLSEPGIKSLTQDLKQKIAQEFNYSETIFIHPYNESSKSRRVDIFTPESELPFAGHPTIGAVWYILSKLSPEKDQDSGSSNGHVIECVLDLKAGKVQGRLDRKTGYASAEIPHDVHVHGVKLDFNRVVGSQPNLLAAGEINSSFKDKTHALVSIVKGLSFALVDLTLQPELLTSLKVVRSYVGREEDIDHEAYKDGVIGSLFFVRKGDGRDEDGTRVIKVEQRVIIIGLEDPATGSASAALCAWLALTEGKAGEKIRFELLQGVQMGRRSVIGCEVTLKKDGTGVEKIVLQGQSRLVMNGEMYL